MRRNSRQMSLFRVSQFIAQPYEPGSLFDVIARYGGFLFRRADFPQADRAKGGEEGHCPVRLSALVVIQQKHGWSDRETVRRAKMDLQVKACLGMGIGESGPSQSALCKHRQRMQALGLDVRYLERLRDLLEVLELVGDDEPVLIDSVPVEGAGQQLDSYNLLASLIGKGLRELARLRKQPVKEVAESMGMSVYLNRSVKGHFDVDWNDEASKRAFLQQLVDDARTVRDCVRQAQSEVRGDDDDEPPSAAQLIDKLIKHDIEFDSQGGVSRIRRAAAQDRLISATDPDMRHGRKSASKLICGYKAQVVASVKQGFVVLARIIKANEHDGHALPDIAETIEEQGLAPAWWGGDHAYGTLANHQYFSTAQRGELIARMARPTNAGRFTKDEFEYDFESKRLTCPAGQVAHPKWAKQRKQRGRRFAFDAKTCMDCPMRERCVRANARPDSGRSVFIIDAEERLIRDHLHNRKTKQFQSRLARRPIVERVIAGLAQCGIKRARRRGMKQVQFDTNLSALAYNLRRLSGLMVTQTGLRSRLNEALRAFACIWLNTLRGTLRLLFGRTQPIPLTASKA